MVGDCGAGQRGCSVIFGVELRIRLFDGAPSAEEVVEFLRSAGFKAQPVADVYINVDFPRVEATGVTAMPEALRKAHLSLSKALRSGAPAFKDRGLLWSDVVTADVRTLG